MQRAPAADPLFVGLTRPAMIAGVTYEALVMNLMVTMIVFIIAKQPVWLALFAPIHAVCCAICALDARAFQLLGLWARTKGAARTRALWHASAYSPLSFARR